MPIRPENKARYPKDWKQISLRIRERAGWRCEFVDANEWRCTAVNGEPHPLTLSRVVLTVAHLDHQPENCDDGNLMAMCQRCHNIYDAPMRRAGIKERARQKMAVADLLEIAAP
jgi:hypothetical protein